MDKLPSAVEVRSITAGLRDMVRYGGNCDHQDRKNLLNRAIVDLEALAAYAERLREALLLFNTGCLVDGRLCGPYPDCMCYGCQAGRALAAEGEGR